MTRRHRRHSIALKRMIVEAYLGGEPLLALSEKFDICRHLIRSWVEKYELGEFDDEHVRTDLVPEYEARIAALERLVGKQALEIEFLRGARMQRPSPRNGTMSVVTGPSASPSEGGASS
jgi:transposase